MRRTLPTTKFGGIWMRQRSWCSRRHGAGRGVSGPRATTSRPRATPRLTPDARLRHLQTPRLVPPRGWPPLRVANLQERTSDDDPLSRSYRNLHFL